MKKLIFPVMLLLFFVICGAAANAESTTVMVYMCGSDLESLYGAATQDIQEMMLSGMDPEQTHVFIMAGGSNGWKEPSMNGAQGGLFTLASKRHDKSLRLSRVDEDVSQMNMGESDSLRFFLDYCHSASQTDRYGLIIWNHGGGPVNGVCWDERAGGDHLTLKELDDALSRSPFRDQKLSFIGFDACLMSSIEVAGKMAQYADYMIASQAEEPSSGWNYAFLNGIQNDENGAEIGKKIVDGFFDVQYKYQADLTMACIDLSCVDTVEQCMDAMYKNLSLDLDSRSFTRFSKMRFSAAGFGKLAGDGGYDLVDIASLCGSYQTEYPQEAADVTDAVAKAVLYNKTNVPGANGISAYHPYRNQDSFISEWEDTYKNLDFCPGYTDYIDMYGRIMAGEQLVRWNDLGEIVEQADGSLTLDLSEGQMENLASARLVVLARNLYDNFDEAFFRVFNTTDVTTRQNRLISAYDDSILCVMNSAGYDTLTGAISYRVMEDGIIQVEIYPYKNGEQNDSSHNIALMNEHPVIAEYVRSDSGELLLKGYSVYDEMTGMYSHRADIDWSAYDGVTFVNQYRNATVNDQGEYLVFDDWNPDVHQDALWRSRQDVARTEFKLSFFDDPSHEEELYVAYEITDTQGNIHMSKPKRLEKSGVGYYNTEICLAAPVPDSSLMQAWMFDDPAEDVITLVLNVYNDADTELRYLIHDVTVNGTSIGDVFGGLYADEWTIRRDGRTYLPPGEIGTLVLFMGKNDLSRFSAEDRIKEICGSLSTIVEANDGGKEYHTIGFCVAADFPMSAIGESDEDAQSQIADDLSVTAPTVSNKALALSSYAVIRPADSAQDSRLLINLITENTTDHDLQYMLDVTALNGVPVDGLSAINDRGEGAANRIDRKSIAPGGTANIVLDIRYRDIARIMPDVALFQVNADMVIAHIGDGKDEVEYSFPVTLTMDIPLDMFCSETDVLPSRQLIDLVKKSDAAGEGQSQTLFAHDGCSVSMRHLFIVDGKVILLVDAENKTDTSRRFFMGNAEIDGHKAAVGKDVSACILSHNRETVVYGLERENWEEVRGATLLLKAGEKQSFYLEIEPSENEPCLQNSISLEAYMYEEGNPTKFTQFGKACICLAEPMPFTEGMEAAAPVEELRVIGGEIVQNEEPCELVDPAVTIRADAPLNDFTIHVEFPDGQAAKQAYYVLLRRVRSEAELAAMNIVNERNPSTGKNLIDFDNGQEWLIYEMTGSLALSDDGRLGTAKHPGGQIVLQNENGSIPGNIYQIESNGEGQFSLIQVNNPIYFISAKFPDAVLPMWAGNISVEYDSRTKQARLTDFGQFCDNAPSLAGLAHQGVSFVQPHVKPGEIAGFFVEDDYETDYSLQQNLMLGAPRIHLALVPIRAEDYEIAVFYKTVDGVIVSTGTEPLSEHID